MIEEFMKDLQKVCALHNASIYPGFVDDKDEEEGVVISIDGCCYSLVTVGRRTSGFSKIEGEEYP